MLRLLLTILTIFAIVVAGIWAFSTLEGEQGLVTIDYGGRVYEFTVIEAVLVLILGIVAAFAAFWLLRLAYTVIRFVLGDETAINRFFTRSREKRGIEALSTGMLALATGDAKTAKRKAQKAERLLDRPGLTRLLNAKAAELNGDTEQARTYYKGLASDKSTAFVGVCGLLEQAVARGDQDKALVLAEKAHELNPTHDGTLETLFTLQSQKFDWSSARQTLKKQRRTAALPGPDADRREAGLALAQAVDASRDGKSEQARDLAVQATKLDPANTEAATTAAKHLTEAGSRRAATKVLIDSWTANPDPRIAATYAEVEPDESPAERNRRFARLLEIHPDHPETHYLKAQLSMTGQDWVGARAALSDLRETEPSARSCAILAGIARGSGEPEHIVRGWLARALSAPRDGVSDMTLSQAAMLPLVIGGDPSPDAADAAGPVEVDQPDGSGMTEPETVTGQVEDRPTNAA